MFRRKSIGLLLLALMIGGALLLAPATAGAYCVYNHTNIEMRVCGGGCARCMKATIPAGGKACCPGGDKGCSGSHVISFSITMGRENCGGWNSRYSVDAHGWVNFSGTFNASFKQCNENGGTAGKDLKVTVYHSDGSVAYQGPVQYDGIGCNW